MLPATASAGDMYQWTDRNGRAVFGSRPPRGATSVKKLKTKRLSRYSSEKMLNRLGWSRNALGSAPLEKRPAESKHESKPAEDKALENKKTDAETAIRKTGPGSPVVPAFPTLLEHSDVIVETNRNGAIAGCTVEVNNPATSGYVDISVAFKFSNGTLVPGVGPDKIASQSFAEYKIPDTLLPIDLDEKDSPAGNSAQVIIHGTLE